MQRKRQFKTAVPRRTFFERKVLPYGSTRTVALGKIIPKHWRYVRINVIDTANNSVTIQIVKLLGDEPIACTPQTNKTSRQNP